ncbi:PREDICTED: uncharacterized protein LOC109173956 [Ipomoea nil]|uniref:uncharacterized protein LOC109173956 n=1 Tax=Ipomoea nil TaxID=35883 RepID=UPI000901F358|nr:PREDICTED: uncharacterized protein LOC109173956 [Ipomoea nil]
MDFNNDAEAEESSSDLRLQMNPRMDLNTPPGREMTPDPVNFIQPGVAFPGIPGQMPLQYPMYAPGMFDPVYPYWQSPQRFFGAQYQYPPGPGAYQPYMPMPMPNAPNVPEPGQSVASAPAAAPELCRAQSERRPARSRLGPGAAHERGAEEVPARMSAFVHLQPSVHQRIGARQDMEESVNLPAPRQEESGEVSSCRSKRMARRAADREDPRNEAKGLLQQVREEFSKWRREHGHRSSEPEAPLLRNPFTADVMSLPYPHDLRIPGNKGYDGKTDPEAHINSYYGNMLMMGVTDAVMCRAFYSTLTGRAADWFQTLEPGSIACFAELAKKFVHKFATSKEVRKHFTYLEKAKQLEGESLTDFLVKWKAAIGEVEPLDDRTAINVLHSNLPYDSSPRAGALYQEFILHPPATYDEAIRRVTDYANAGEANFAKRQQEADSSRKPQGRQEEGKTNDRSGRGRGRAPDFTPLNRPAVDVLRFSQSCNMIQLPEPQREGRDKTKYCAYHRSKGHETEDCTTLRQVIEELLRSGKLTEFTNKKDEKKSSWKNPFKKSNKNKKDKDHDRDTEPRQSTGKQVIHVIFGGPEESSNAREKFQIGLIGSEPSEKRQKLEPITFTPSDMLEGEDCNTEALVVTIDIMGTDVQRVMVDTGSSVNVLYMDVFQKLKLEPIELTPIGTPLSGFTGDTIHPEGKITLPVEIGN